MVKEFDKIKMYQQRFDLIDFVQIGFIKQSGDFIGQYFLMKDSFNDWYLRCCWCFEFNIC